MPRDRVGREEQDSQGDFQEDDGQRRRQPHQAGKKRPSSSTSAIDCSVQEGQILVSERWRGSDLAQSLQRSFSVKFCDLQSADFRPSSELLLLFLPESDYVSGARTYKQKLARLLSSASKSRLEPVVVCQRTELSAKDFLAVQELAVIELSLAVVPVSDLSHLPQLLAQFATVGKRQNPFKFGSQTTSDDLNSRTVHKQLIETLACIPALGDKRARALLLEFKNLQGVAEATESDLERLIGSGPAKAVHQFFN